MTKKKFHALLEGVENPIITVSTSSWGCYDEYFIRLCEKKNICSGIIIYWTHFKDNSQKALVKYNRWLEQAIEKAEMAKYNKSLDKRIEGFEL